MELNEAIKSLKDRIKINNLMLESHGSDFEEFVQHENDAIETLIKEIEQPKQVMVIWATDIIDDKKSGSPWIYGTYTDIRVGAKVQDAMQSSEDYGHLYWSNNVVLLDKKFNKDKI